MPAPLVRLPAAYVHYAHSTLAFLAFTGTFALACSFHFKQVVKNGIARWPEEWVPSVSATIGDWAPERPFFQILIAICSGPRFLLIFLQWLVTRRKSGQDGVSSHKKKDDVVEGKDADREVAEWTLADWTAVVGTARTFTCGGWVYVTSTDHHDFHDISMIAYLVLTIPWMFGTISLTSYTRPQTLKMRKYVAAAFFGSIPPLVYFFIRHKVHRIPGAYSYYSLFEWGLVLIDVAFDAVGAGEVSRLQLQVVYLDGADPAQNNSVDGTHPISSNPFALGEALRPAILGVSDQRMELSTQDAGWVVAANAGLGETVMSAWRLVAFGSDLYLNICYWTIFTNLAMSLFYFSVWELALSGSELSLLATMTPYVLAFPRLSRFATSRRGHNILRTITIVCGMSAWATPGPKSRLLVVSVANATMWCGMAAGLFRLNGSEAARTEALLFAIGILSTVVLKFLNYSINPLWCVVDADSNGWNRTGLALALLACIEKWLRPNSLQSEPQDVQLEVSSTTPPAKVTHKAETDLVTTSRHPALVALGFGSLIFLVQTFISDASTIIAWNWSGYPINDQPTYMEHSPVVITCAAAAIIQPFAFRLYRDITRAEVRDPRVKSYMERHRHRHTVLGIIAFVACVILCGRTAPWAQQGLLSGLMTERNGFIAGCVGIAFLLQALPRYFQGMSTLRSYKLFGHAMLLYVILDVLSVVTVAYAFVPGGQFFRERGGLVISIAFLLVVVGEWYLPSSHAEKRTDQRHGPHSSSTRRYSALVIGLLVSSAWLFQFRFKHGMASKTYSRVMAPGKPDELFSAGIWTVHFGVDLSGRESQKRQLELIRDLDLDVVGLLESDLHRFVYGNRDLTRMLVEELGYNVDLGPGPNKHTWGAALLSRYPILESHHMLLPSPHGELAPAIHAKLLIANQTINVIVSHNGQEEDALDRQLQTEALAKVMRESYPEPFVFLGYVVTHVGAQRPAPYEILMSDGRMWDIEIEDKDRWCEYIAFRNLWRVGYARISHGHITDTELQAAKFIVPRDNAPVDYATNEQLYYHTYEGEIPEGWRFPQMFRNNGTRGHQYHVFDGPLSYWPTASFWETWGQAHPKGHSHEQAA